MRHLWTIPLLTIGLACSWSANLHAAEGEPAEPVTQAKPAPYSLPWFLRPMAAKTVVRSDTAIGLSDQGSAIASTLLGGVGGILPNAGIYAKISYNHISPDQGDSASALSNPALIGLFTPKLGSNKFRMALALAVAFPLGQGGGNSPDLGQRAAILSGITTRQGMENALFVPNYLTPFGGIGVAYVDSGATLQAEITLLELLRVKGEDLDQDKARTNFTSGIHAGYAVLDHLTLSVEAHYQRWLSTPAFVEADNNRREQATALAGVRVPFAVDAVKLNPGVSYARAIDQPMSGENWQIVQLDIPVVF